MPEPPPSADTLEKIFLKEPIRTSTSSQKERVVFAKPVGEPVGGAEWNFGWDDLKRVGSKLVFAEDVSWVPQVIQQNIINTIKYVLDLNNAIDGVVLSQGVNLRDFYHGHVVYPKSSQQSAGTQGSAECGALLPRDVEQSVDVFRNNYQGAVANTKALEGPYLETDGRIRQPTTGERELIRRADAQVMKDFRAALGLIAAKLPGAAMIYHTHEHDKLARDAKQRNILTQFSDGILKPGDYYNAYDSPQSAFCHLLQVDFLVNPRGEVFLRGGEDRSLAGLEYR